MPIEDMIPPEPKDKATTSDPEPVEESPQPTPTVTSVSAVSTPASKPKRKWLLPLILLLLIAAGAGAYFALMRGEDEAPATNNTAEKKDIASLNVAITEAPTGLFPQSSVSNTDYQINGQLFEGLVAYEQRSKIVPLLAESWTNPDASTWVFKLKSDVKFHSGNTMTAADVKASIEYIQKNNESLNGTFASTIKSVKVVDASTVEIKTDGADPTLLNKLSFLYIFDSKVNPTKEAAGTGPYQLKGDVAKFSTKKVDLTAFDGYHRGHVYTRALSFVVTASEEASIKGLQDGVYNIVGDLGDDNVAKASTFQQFKVEDTGVYFLNVNSLKEDSPLQKAGVRKAIEQAIDVESLMEAHNFNGKVASQIVSQDIPGYNPSVERPAYDVAAAKKSLADAGYADGITLTIDYVKDLQKPVDEIIKQAAAAGITIKEREQPDLDSIFGSLATSDLVFLNYSSDVLDGNDVLQTVFFGLGTQDDEQLTKLADQIGKATTAAARLELLQQAIKRSADQTIVIPLYSRTRVWLTDKNYTMTQDHPSATLGVYFWKVHM